MRLINTKSQAFEEFVGSNIPKYAILSHTWGKEEVSYSDYNRGKSHFSRMRGFEKIDKTCRIAAKEGIKYAWIDTCCIDKRSSAELTEAINSMFHWYKEAAICYAFFSDLVDRENPKVAMKSCRWFTRGWTLQELIAAETISFFDSQWRLIGTKKSLCSELSAITWVPIEILLHREALESRSVAERMSWAAHRKTTRVEDTAYSLLGIFDVNMPLLYGEGSKAFQRLQENIINSTNDLSIFLWNLPPETTRLYEDKDTCGILAIAPICFSHAKRGLSCTRAVQIDFSMTNKVVKMRTNLYLVAIGEDTKLHYILPIYHSYAKDSGISLGVPLRKVGDGLFARHISLSFCEMRRPIRERMCPGEHHLLLRPLNQSTSDPLKIANYVPVSDRVARSIRIKTGDNARIIDVWPRSRFDESEQAYFHGDKDVVSEDWGTVQITVHPKADFLERTLPPIPCMIYVTSWGHTSAPVYSILDFGKHTQHMTSLQSELKSWDHTTGEFVYALKSKGIPRMSPILSPISDTPFTAVISLTCMERTDCAFWEPEGKAWDLEINCDVQKTDSITSRQTIRKW